MKINLQVLYHPSLGIFGTSLIWV
uniref:Uncharacterized protein n=1 Tax=Arundo donax TaxID=35708 RepID=A0A0A9ALI3_ARUDO